MDDIVILNSDLQGLQFYSCLFPELTVQLWEQATVHEGTVFVYDHYRHTPGQFRELMQFCSVRALIVISDHKPGLWKKSVSRQASAVLFLSRPLDAGLLVKKIFEIRAVPVQHELIREMPQGDAASQSTPAKPQKLEMAELWQLVDRLAAVDASVLITGESGTGKDVAAHRIHKKSSRCKGPFIAINCAALTSDLFASEMFGVVEGAYTGAVNRRGAYRSADKGTLFLDEIAELDLASQAALLRLIESGMVRSLGSDACSETDVRLITATNANLFSLMEEGSFRRDLYYRLMIYHIHMPSLRERLYEIPSLCEHFLKIDFPERKVSLSACALELLRSYSWPGNIRELRNVITRSMLHQEGPALKAEDICLCCSCGQSALEGWPGIPGFKKENF
ncbi:sigma 54-interacting transcriptional regulator [Spirochaeta dissipatitropha]